MPTRTTRVAAHVAGWMQHSLICTGTHNHDTSSVDEPVPSAHERVM